MINSRCVESMTTVSSWHRCSVSVANGLYAWILFLIRAGSLSNREREREEMNEMMVVVIASSSSSLLVIICMYARKTLCLLLSVSLARLFAPLFEKRERETCSPTSVYGCCSWFFFSLSFSSLVSPVSIFTFFLRFGNNEQRMYIELRSFVCLLFCASLSLELTFDICCCMHEYLSLSLSLSCSLHAFNFIHRRRRRRRRERWVTLLHRRTMTQYITFRSCSSFPFTSSILDLFSNELARSSTQRSKLAHLSFQRNWCWWSILHSSGYLYCWIWLHCQIVRWIDHTQRRYHQRCRPIRRWLAEGRMSRVIRVRSFVHFRVLSSRVCLRF